MEKHEGLVLQKADNAIHWINRYSVGKWYQNKVHYPLDSDLSGGENYPLFEQPGSDLVSVVKILNSIFPITMSYVDAVMFSLLFAKPLRWFEVVLAIYHVLGFPHQKWEKTVYSGQPSLLTQTYWENVLP